MVLEDMMHRKGQIEIAALLGIFAVLAVVAYYAFASGVLFPEPVPQAVGVEQNLIKDAIITELRKGAVSAIKLLEQQGGFITPEAGNSVSFTNAAVPYWQKCGNSNMKPTLRQITERLESAVKNHAKDSLAGKREYFGKNASFGLDRMSVSANILASKIDFAVSLPAAVQGYALQQPMTFSIPTKFGEIYEFGKNFADENADKRLLEHFTIATIYFSGELETQGVLTRCGESVFLSGERIRGGLYDAIAYTLANIMWWKPMPPAGDGRKAYSIESLNGKTYPSLSAGLYLPDLFRLTLPSPLLAANNQPVAVAPVWTVPMCIALYSWRYSADYPVIVSIKDELAGSRFNFAVLVDIDSLLPGNCARAGSRSGSQLDMNCSASLMVTGSGGTPLEGASANFGGYRINKSGPDGVINGPAVCGTDELYIEKEGYGSVRTNATANITEAYTLYKIPGTEFKFNEVEVEEYINPIQFTFYKKCLAKTASDNVMLNISNGQWDYLVSNIEQSIDMSGACWRSQNCNTCFASRNESDCRRCSAECGIRIMPSVYTDYIPGGDFTIISDVWNRATYYGDGGFVTNYRMPEYNASLFINAPLIHRTPFNRLLFADDAEKIRLTESMKSKCNIEPITTEEPKSFIEMQGCGCIQLKELVENEFASCVDANVMFDGSNCIESRVINAIGSNCSVEVRGC